MALMTTIKLKKYLKTLEKDLQGGVKGLIS